MEILVAQLVPLIYTIVSPFVTEALKVAAEKTIASVPKNAIPIMGAIAGAVVGGLAQWIDPTIPMTSVIDGVNQIGEAHPLAGLTPLSGLIAGLAGTGVHQMRYANGYAWTGGGMVKK